SNRTGGAGEGVLLKVPVGTQILLEDGETLLADMTTPGERVIVARGGKGGLGNAHFKSSVNRAPRKTIPGEEGEERWLWLKLKLLSDAGLIGFPNAGKSTFLARVTRAKPKIADYPFTTLVPQLGVVAVDSREFVLADLPGLIKGAHAGVGLGDRFLKHVERCGVLLHLVDITNPDRLANYHMIRQELVEYNPVLMTKQEIVGLSKCDALDAEEAEDIHAAFQAEVGVPVYLFSSASGEGWQELLRALCDAVVAFRQQESIGNSAAPNAAV
ncbi:MAG: GTPase ObgE, partial [Rickettsiales bacterium]|nr:GTPase ObgE [Rickettsiales bacterium]